MYNTTTPSTSSTTHKFSLPISPNTSLPAHLIIDQGRSGLQNTRTSWEDWCNVEARFGIRPTTKTNSTLIDSIVWVKPVGKSDGACGSTIDGVMAPNAGNWWEAYMEIALSLKLTSYAL